MQLLGNTSDFETFPELLTIDDDPYILRKSEGEYRLYSAVCPHKEGTVKPVDEDTWLCPDHGWEFDSDGNCTTVSTECLESYPVRVENGTLYADIESETGPSIDLPSDPDAEPPTITLAGHASLLFEHEGFRLLTDPWLFGEAFLSSWTQYPPSPFDRNDLGDIDAIWITHEHSDHLHEATLEQFDSSTPIYIPEFRCHRLRRRLVELGFTDITVIPTGEPTRLHDNIMAISFESGSAWNDTLQYLNFGGFEVLNANDAGINREVKDAVGTVDLVSSAFSQGASGYPLTWTHLSEAEKQQTIAESNAGLLNMFGELADLFEPDYVLPFASYQGLWLPDHEPYIEQQEKNAPADVVAYLEDRSTDVLDLYPGERWDGQTITRRDDHSIWYSEGHREEYLEEYTNECPLEDRYTNALSHEQLRQYFEAFSGSEYAIEAGDLAVSFTATGDSEDETLTAKLRFNDGHIRYEPTPSAPRLTDLDATYNLRMACPAGLVESVIERDLSWDEISTGYWGTFERDPDKYNIGFWKLLHVPWEARQETHSASRLVNEIEIDSPVADEAIADLVEKDPDTVGRILQDHGLHCVGCHAAIGESIIQGCANHGFSKQQTKQVVNDLESAL